MERWTLSVPDVVSSLLRKLTFSSPPPNPCQEEIKSRAELERRLQEAEDALQRLEQGLSSAERTVEKNERMKGDVGELRSK
ncbi:hypothetical protein chiPu_0025974 [Chiloscyllium punctatum]|uniref:Uncharacterized protein n=1 Tax=Chiloscyllium punctatum TaxID=137246 RepID=A0A401TGQ3_CHIPU|nr:hypothetical protein [Chiloscyllium punctatum]